jgi:hypothetical protein
LHEAVLWLRHSTHTELSVGWPVGVRVLRVTVDGAGVTPLQPEPGRLWLPLPGRPGLRQVVVRWQYDPADEPLAQPRLTRPRVEGAQAGPGVWTVRVPAGWEVGRVGDRGTVFWGDRAAPGKAAAGATDAGGAIELEPGYGGGRRAVLDAWQAQMELERSKDLVGEAGRGAPPPGPALLEVQTRFYQAGRRVEQAMELGADHGRRVGPDGRTLTMWWRELSKANRALAAKGRFEEVRARAEKRARSGATHEQDRTEDRLVSMSGVPVSWLASGGEGEPAPRLVPWSEGEKRTAWMVSGQWLSGLLLVCLVAMSRRLRRAARWLWPELLALLAVLGWHLAGVTLVVLVLAAVALLGRVVLLARGVRWLSVARA